jgi:hypothetical protein
MLADPRRIRRIRSLGHSLRRLTAAATMLKMWCNVRAFSEEDVGLRNRAGGPSLNHLGKKCFAFSSLDKSNIPDILAKL